jgi:uncharacterized protein (TIGR02246 family)
MSRIAVVPSGEINMRRALVFGSFLSTLWLCGLATADEAAVKKLIGDYVSAFNSENFEAVAGFWSESGVHVDRETGERTEGREAVKADIAEAFQQYPGIRIAGNVGSVRLIRPDVASVDGEVTVSVPGQDPTQSTFSAILTSTDGKWLIDSIEESPVVPPATSADALRDLEWTIGRWVDDGGDTRVETDIRWSPNQAFLIRSFVVTTADGEVREGTQVVGFDPRSVEIRSWTFQSDGGFGDATWSRSGDDWLVKSSQTLPDGRAASGTFVYSRVSDDEMTVRLIGHEIEGEPQPSGEAITIKRVVEEVEEVKDVAAADAVANP